MGLQILKSLSTHMQLKSPDDPAGQSVRSPTAKVACDLNY